MLHYNQATLHPLFDRVDGENVVSFYQGQEGVYFVRDFSQIPPYGGDVIVKLY